MRLKHIAVSHCHYSAHGQVEHFVQTVKNLMKKAYSCDKNWYFSLTNLVLTPIDPHLPIPPEILNKRRYRNLLPCIT